MALKKGAFQNYVSNKEQERKIREIKSQNSKYKHHKVFDEDSIWTDAEQEEEESHETIIIKPTADKKPQAPTTTQQKSNAVQPKKQEVLSTPITITSNTINDINKQILSLTGLQQKLFFGLLKMAFDNNRIVLSEISSAKLQQLTESTYNNTKLAIFRLVQKKILIRYKGKTARNGYYCLGFDEQTYNIAIVIAKNLNGFTVKTLNLETIEIL